MNNDGSSINRENFETLLKWLSDTEDITAGDLSPLEEIIIGNDHDLNFDEIQRSTAGGRVYEYCTVYLGYAYWTPTYVTKDANGNIILALWLVETGHGQYDSWSNVSDYVGVYPSYKGMSELCEECGYELINNSPGLNQYLVSVADVPYLNGNNQTGFPSQSVNMDLSYSQEHLQEAIAELTPEELELGCVEMLTQLYDQSRAYIQESRPCFFLPSAYETGTWSVEGLDSQLLLRNISSKLYDGDAPQCYYSDGSWDTIAGSLSESYYILPAVHLNLTKISSNYNLDYVSSDSSDPDIYKIETEKGIDFHIKSADGFLELSSLTAAGGTFDPSWTFYLDNDIAISVDSTYTPIGGDANPFVSKFDGQNHEIYFANAPTVTSLAANIALFGTVGSCSIENLRVNFNINISRFMRGLVYNSIAGSTCNLSHLTLQGTLVGRGGASNIIGYFQGDVILYDVNVYCEKIGIASNRSFISANSINMDSCKIMIASLGFLNSGGAGGGLSGYMLSSKTITISNTYIELTCSSNFYLFQNCENATISECQFKRSGGSNTYLLYGNSTNLTIYDTLINSDNLSTLYSGGNAPTADGSTYYYSGVYIHDPKANDGAGKTTIINPDFTSSKWCMDPHLNNGLPQLRRFVSIGDFMEQCDMAAWAASQ